MQVTVRPARADDAAPLAAFHHRCWLEGYRGLVPDEVLAGLRAEERERSWASLLAGDLGTTSVLVDDADRPVAVVRVHESTIEAVYVDPDHWRSGLGRRLVQEGERLLHDAGVRDADLWTLVGNDRALALYESEGWRLDGTDEWHEHPFGFRVHEQRLVKRLG